MKCIDVIAEWLERLLDCHDTRVRILPGKFVRNVPENFGMC